jgi:3-oxo-4-pregnene-20-carboxyl-CoA dehydrogenase alpha subunit
MNIDMTEAATLFGRVVRDAIGALGGDDLLTGGGDRGEPATSIGNVLGDLGAWDLDVSAPEELEAAAATCHAAGWWGLPYPVAERLSRPRDLDVDGMSVIDPVRPRASTLGPDRPWAAVELSGSRSIVAGHHQEAGPLLSAHVADVELVEAGSATTYDVAVAVLLPCWTLLGMLERAISLTVGYVTERSQFGQRLSQFQHVQFELTEAELERSGADVVVRYAVSSLEANSAQCLVDALAARATVTEAADRVFRICHQLHGAIGFCDETTISWISRNSQPLRRLPYPAMATHRILADLVGTSGISGIFDGVSL